jgi:hypothetical protein
MSREDATATPRWMVGVMLAVAVLLAAAIAVIGSRTLTAGEPLCDPHFPARHSSFPVWAYVFVSIGAFGFGHVAGQWGIWRQGRGQQALGEGRWRNPRAVIGINVGVAVFLFIVTGLLLYEGYTLGHGVWPITYYVRCSNDAGPLVSLLGSAIYAFVIGRWMWVFKD